MSRHACRQRAGELGRRPGRPAGWQRTTAAVQGLAAVVVLAGLLVGAPLVLLALGTKPLPDHLPALQDLIDRARQLATSPDDGTLLLAVLQIVAWVSWGVFALSAAVEGLAVAAGRTTPAIRGLALVQRPTAYLVAVIAAGVTTPVASAAAAAPALPSHPVADAPAIPRATPTPAGATSPAGDARTSSAAPVLVGAYGPYDGTAEELFGFAGPTRSGGVPSTQPGVRRLPAVQVGRYDSLWRIADRYLGDGRRWAEVYRLNIGRTQPDGSRLTDPDRLEEGWTLLLPADARGVSPDPTSLGEASAGCTGTVTPAPGRESVVLVRPGDTLSGIAELHLGTAEATQAVFEANVGRFQPDGGRLTDPDLIRPGWRLTLPVMRSQPIAGLPTAPHSDHPDRPSTEAPRPGGPPRQTPPARPAPSSTASSSAQRTTPPPGRPAAPTTSVYSTPVPSTPTASSPAASDSPPSSSAPAPGSSTSETGPVPSAPGPGGEHTDRTPGGWVQLPSGSILGLGLITVVAGLLELLRRRRRQHRVPGDPSDSEPSAARPPAAVRAAEEAWLAARRRLTQPDDTDGDPNDDLGDDPDERGTDDAGDVEDRYFTDPATDLGLDPGHAATATEVSGRPVRRLRVQVPAPAPDLPADDVVTRRRGLSPGQFPAPSLLALIGPPAAAPLARRAWSGGAGLVGPGAAGAARAVIARLLTAVGPMGGELVTTEAAVADLLPADGAEGFAATPGVTVFGTLRDALAACEADLLARARWLFDHEDLASHRDDPAALPVPAVLLVAHAPEATPADAPLAAHTDVVLRLGARRELGAVLLGAWPATTLAVSADGTLSEPSQSEAASVAGMAPVGRVELLTASDAADLLAGLVPPLRDALDVLDPTTLLPPFKTGATKTPADESPDAEERAERSPGEPGDSGAAHADGSGRGAGVVPVAPSRVAQAPDTPVLEVAVFGRVRLLATQDGGEVTGVRAKIRNLLALLAVHPDGLTSDQVGDALWPEAPPDRIPGRLSATLALTRRLLRESAHATAQPAAPTVAGTSSGGAVGRNPVLTEAVPGRVDLVPMVDGRYQLHPTLIGSDYRRFTDALAEAAEARRAGNDSSRRVALRTVADVYRGHDGEILGGVDYSWAIPIRERLRRQATDALATLASLLSARPNTADPRIDYRAGEDRRVQVDDGTRDASAISSRPAPHADEDAEERSPDAVHDVAVDEALEALEQAMDVDPYNEDLYRQVMRLHAAAGRREDVYQTLRLLEARLLDIDAEPDPATSALVTQLLRTSPARPAQGKRSDRTGPARGTSRSAERG